MKARISEGKFKHINRRELLKLSPALALGAFAVPGLRMPLLRSGLGFSDWISATLFREDHLAQVYTESDLTPFCHLRQNYISKAQLKAKKGTITTQ